MDFLRFTFLGIIVALGFSACNSSSVYKAEVAKVDSLSIKVDSLKGVLAKIDLDKVEEDYVIIKDRLDFLVNNYPDEHDRKFWTTDMTSLGSTEKNLRRFREKYPSVSLDIEKSAKQLSTLRNSLEDEKLSIEEAEKYMAEESNAVTDLKFRTNELRNRVEMANEVWKLTQPYFDSLTLYHRGSL